MTKRSSHHCTSRHFGSWPFSVSTTTTTKQQQVNNNNNTNFNINNRRFTVTKRSSHHWTSRHFGSWPFRSRGFWCGPLSQWWGSRHFCVRPFCCRRIQHFRNRSQCSLSCRCFLSRSFVDVSWLGLIVDVFWLGLIVDVFWLGLLVVKIIVDSRIGFSVVKYVNVS